MASEPMIARRLSEAEKEVLFKVACQVIGQHQDEVMAEIRGGRFPSEACFVEPQLYRYS